MLLAGAGSILPKGLEFLEPGWWLLHALAFALVFAWGYRRGRLQERREQRAREKDRGQGA